MLAKQALRNVFSMFPLLKKILKVEFFKMREQTKKELINKNQYFQPNREMKLITMMLMKRDLRTKNAGIEDNSSVEEHGRGSEKLH